MSHGHRVAHLKFTLPAIIEEPERRVASLLEFREHESWPDGVDRASGNKNDVAPSRRPPVHKFLDGAVLDRRLQFAGCNAMFKPDGDFSPRLRRQNIPCFGFSALEANRLRE